MTTFTTHTKKFLIPILLIIITVLITLIVSDLFQGCHVEKQVDSASYNRLKLINLSLVVCILILIAFVLYLPYNNKKLKSENNSLKTSCSDKDKIIVDKDQVIIDKDNEIKELKRMNNMLHQQLKNEDNEYIDDEFL